MIRKMLAGLAAAVTLMLAGNAIAAGGHNWTATVTVPDDGTHILGNPDAKVKLTEYVSYTCPHCAHFNKQAEVPLRLAYVMPGKVSVRIAHVIRDPIDLTVAMLTNCGDPKGFFFRHNMFLNRQEEWLGKLNGTTEAQRVRWQSGDMPSRFRAIASDFGFYDMMASRGFSRVAVDRCFTDKAMAEKIVAQTSAAAKLGVTGTPSFAFDGVLDETDHDWASIEGQIKSRLQ